MSMLFKMIKDWAVSITSFRTGDVLPVDGPSGTAKIGYSDLAKEVIKDSANNPAATEADMTADAKLPIMTTGGPKALPANLVVKQSDLEAASRAAVKYDVVENGPSVFSNSGFIDSSGAVNSDDHYCYTDYIDISDALSVDAYGMFVNPYGGGIEFLDAAKNHISSIYNTGGNRKIVDKADFPAGAAFIRVTTSTALQASSFVNLKKLPSDIAAYIDSLSPHEDVFNNSLHSRSASMLNGDVLTVHNIPSAQNNNTLHFFACITTFSAVEIYIGSLDSMWESAKIKIDDSSIYLYNWSNSGYDLVAPHGLTLSQFIHVDIITAAPNRRATLKLKSSGGQYYECTLHPWRGYGSNFAVTSVGSSLSKVSMSYSGKCFSCIDTAIFSDSYSEGISQNLGGCDSYVLDGYAGRGSAAAFSSFQKMLALGKPKFVAWLMGMNDRDSSDAVNESYKRTFDGMRALCQAKGILFVPFTIPNVPERIHYYKNLYIKNSGLFYVDMSAALGADEIGSSWFSGLLSQDNVHPTARGYEIIGGVIKGNFASILSNYSADGV